MWGTSFYNRLGILLWSLRRILEISMAGVVSRSPTLALGRAHMETQKLESTADCRKTGVQVSSVPEWLRDLETGPSASWALCL